MNVEKVLSELSEKYPNKVIFKNSETDPTEIICEVAPSIEHPDFSNAVAVIDKSIPHIHRRSTETYKVTRGEITMFVGNETVKIREGESYVITPNKVHWAEGNETWIECHSKPGWTFEDQIPAKTRDVAVVIFYDSKGNIGVQHRESYSKAGEKYGLWGGGKETGENSQTAMRREMLEELGYVPEELVFWKYFTYVVDIEGKYKDWVINHDVFLSPITDKLLGAKILEGDNLEVMSLEKALVEPDFRWIKPLLMDFKVYFKSNISKG